MSEGGGRTALAGVAAVSFSGLLLEMALTRLFSVVLYYHFAFLAISIALLGLGAGGVLASLLRRRFAPVPTRRIAARLCLAHAIVTVAALLTILRIPIPVEVSSASLARLAALYLVAAAPFFLSGLILSVVLARARDAVHRLYAADLVGGAAACIALVPLLTALGAPNAVIAAAASTALAAAIWADTSPLRSVAAGLALALLAAIGANRDGALVDVVYAKGVRRDVSRSEFVGWNAISRVEVVVIDDGGRTIAIDSDATSAIVNVDPARWGDDVFGFNWRRHLMSAAPSVVNVLRPRGSYAIIGAGGGVDVLRAVGGGSPRVDAIEINPIIADTLMRDRYARYSFGLYDRPEVRVRVAEGRSFIRASAERYDVVQMTLVDTWASTSAGAIALCENSLYTVEAFRDYLRRLEPDGIVAVTRWEFRRPREALRVVSQAIEALRAEGVADARRHFIVVADGALDEDGRPVAVLAKRSPFTPGEEDLVRAHLARTPNLSALYLPSDLDASAAAPDTDAGAGGPDWRAFRALISCGDPRAFATGYPYDVSPVTDDAPFFFFTSRAGHVLDGVLAGGERALDWRHALGVVILAAVVAISVIAVLAFLLLPLALSARGERPAGGPPLPYFVAVGLGYMLVEVALIQRFSLYLGHPTYAVTVVVFLMLLASGAGSAIAPALAGRLRGLRAVIAAVAVAVAALAASLPGALEATVGLPLPGRLLVAGVALFPPALLMGMPFAAGLRALAGSARGDAPPAGPGIEWAFAVNAAASVLGSVLAMAIAVRWGLTATLASGAAAYVAALALARAPAPGMDPSQVR